ncbi:MAG TPA: DNA repair exonuclease [Candidatus Altiarchaeales archaeon]|nr:DNA repair exonuclease [Candidatus Altiarchaeales archaeon]
MKILHTADIHLREYGDERWKTLQRLIDIGKKEKIELFVICGDLFDKGIDAEILRPQIREIFSNNGFKIILIPGNHDSEAYKSGMYFGEDTTVLTDLNKPFEYKDLMIWGLPFEDMESEKILNKLHSLANNLATDKRNILLYHGELLDTFFSRKDFGEEGERRYMPVKLSYFKDLNIDYVLAGHLHSKFDMWKLENGGYFVYPGSPVSITKREVGRRKANIFEVGKPPKEYPLDTFHFEEMVIELDPFIKKNPIEIIKEHLKGVHSEASIILTIRGYINSEKIKINESELVKQIKEVIKEKSVEEHFEFRDIHTILEDDLFRSFIKKLEQTDYNEEKKKKLRDLVIRAMMEVRP